MRYYYFPSTFFNQGKGRRRGGALRGYGYMVAGTLKGGVADVQKVDPVALAAALPPPEQNVLANMEATAKPAELGDNRWSLWKLWNGLKTVVGDTWNGVKDVVGFAGDTLGRFGWTPLDVIGAINEYRRPPGAVERFATRFLNKAPELITSTGNAIGSATSGVGNVVGNAVGTAVGSATSSAGKSWNPFGWFRSGKGYNKRRARFKKGSPEAKAYMARLRAMRRRR